MIIKSYKPDKLPPQKKCMEFLGAGESSRAQAIIEGHPHDMRILKTWEKHFQDLGVPYFIEKRGKSLYLIKERRI